MHSFLEKIISPILDIKRRFKILKFFLSLFALFIIFFDDNSMLKRLQYHLKVMELNREITFYKKEIEESKAKFNELNSNKENLEKFAREQFLMKKKNEEIFLIEAND